MAKLKQLNELESGKYLAVGSNGRLYNATFDKDAGRKGVVYFIIPQEVEVLGYILPEEKENIKQYRILYDTASGQKEIVCNEFELEKRKQFITRNFGEYSINTLSVIE